MSDSDLSIALRGSRLDVFNPEPLLRLALGLHEVGYRLRRRIGETSPPLEYRIGESWHISDVSTFTVRAAQARSFYLQMFAQGFDVSLAVRDLSLSSPYEHQRGTYARLHVERVYFNNRDETGRFKSGDLGPLRITQAVLRLCGLLADILIPRQVYGGPQLQFERLEAQLDWAGTYVELPWLFDLDPRKLRSEARKSLDSALPTTIMPITDGRLLIAVSENPVDRGKVADEALGAHLLAALNSR